MEWWMWVILFFVVIGMFGNSKEQKEKADAEKEVLRRRKEAEDYIMSSGDPEAIKMLMLARANPANYSQVLAGGMNKGNNTLKTALGVMTGVAVGNLVATAITASAVSSALDNMHTELNTPDLGSVADSSVDISSWTDDLFG
jgi:hypothetical protein